MLVANKADLRHLRAVSTEDAKAFAEREKLFFMETSALESLNVENAFSEVLTQVYHVVCRKALDAGGDPTALPKGQTIDIGSKDDVSEVKKVGCCSAWAGCQQIFVKFSQKGHGFCQNIPSIHFYSCQDFEEGNRGMCLLWFYVGSSSYIIYIQTYSTDSLEMFS